MRTLFEMVNEALAGGGAGRRSRSGCPMCDRPMWEGSSSIVYHVMIDNLEAAL